MIPARKNIWIWVIASLVLLFSLYARFKIINGSLPYIGHPDEEAITKPALRILKTGDFNPHTFIYPSLPFYLTAAAFVVGYVNSVSHGDIRDTTELGQISYPFYSPERLVFPAKMLFALLSVIGMALVGIMAYNVFPKKHLIYLPPLLLALSSLYLYQSARYLNVDIIGTFFAVLTIIYIINKLEFDSYLPKAVLPGILCGLSIASKYNYYLILIPSVLAIIFYSKEKRLKKILLFLLITAITFIVCTPYSLLDFNTFLDGIAFNISHYKSGHLGFTETPGWPQFSYYCQALVDEYGFGFIALALLGLFSSLISDTKKGLILVSFPLLLLINLSSLTVHFLRNILIIYVFVCVYCAFGIILAYKHLNLWLKKIPFLASHKIIQKAVPVLIVTAVILIFLPIQKIASAYDLKPDSRNLSLKWIEANVLYDSIIFVPTELDLDTSELEKNYKIKYFEGLKLTDDFSESIPGSYVLVPFYGYDSRDSDGKEISSRLNRSFKNIVKIVEFGKSPVLVSYSRPVPAGNPKFYIGETR